MSTVIVNTLTGTTTAGSISVTGEGNSTTTNLQQGLCKSWCNFDGQASGAAARDSFNVGSVTDHGTGQYTVNFATNMSNDDYCLTVSHSLNPHNNITHGTLYIYDESSQTTSGVRVHNCNNQGSSQTVDKNIVCVSIFGDQ